MSITCAYEGCTSIKYPCGRITFFVIPNDERRATWIKNSGNKRLLNIGPTSRRFFCEKHFQQSDIRSSFNRKILEHHAVPLPHSSITSDETTTDDIKRLNYKIDETTQTIKQIQNEDVTHAECNPNTTGPPPNTPDTRSFIEPYQYDTNNIPYEIVNIYKGDGDSADKNIIVEIVAEEQDSLSSLDKEMQTSLESLVDEKSLETSLEILVDEKSMSSKQSQLSISTIIKNESGCSLHKENKDEDNTSDVEIEEHTPLKKRRIVSEDLEPKKVDTTKPDMGYEEDTHFALSLVGYFRRLPQGRKALAKLKILQYLTELTEGELETSL